jgi:hypothetical protein
MPAITKRTLGAVKIYTHIPYRTEYPTAKFTGVLRFFTSLVEFVFMPHISYRIFLATVQHEIPHIGEIHTTPFTVHAAH